MSDNEIRPRMVLVAPHGSKKGWLKVTADLPQELKAALDADRGKLSVSDKVYQIVRAHYDRAA